MLLLTPEGKRSMEQLDPDLDTEGAHEDNVDDELLSELFTVLGDASPDGLIRACDLFLTGVPARLADAEDAVAEARLDDAGRLAHSLRGSAGAFGARHLGRLAEQLEMVCGQADPKSAGPLVEEMKVEFAAFRTILTSRLASISSG